MAHFHDLATKIFHSGIGAAVLHAWLCIAGSVHIWQEWDLCDSQRIDNDVNMNVTAVIVSVRVGADDSLMTGKVLCAKFFSKLLRLVNG